MPRKQQRARQRKDRQPGRADGPVIRTGSRDSRRRCADTHGSSSPTDLEQLEQLLARRALVPFAVGGDDREQRVGGGVAVARRHLARRRGRSAPPWSSGLAATARGERRRDRRPAALLARARARRGARSIAGVLGELVGSASASAASASSSRPGRDQRADAARQRPRDGRAPSRRSASKIASARSASPSASTSSPIAISGSSSASASAPRARPAAASSNWSSIVAQLRFGARAGQVGDRAGPGTSHRPSGSSGPGIARR